MIRKLLLAVMALAGATLLAPGAATPQPRSTADCDLLIDASGSMKGFGAAADPQLMRILGDLRRACPRTYQFGDLPAGGSPLRPLGPGAPIVFDDHATNLGPAVRAWSDGAADGAFLVLVTDNVADTTDNASDPTEQFYKLLRETDSPISHIAVMAIRAPFKGLLFDPRDDTAATEYGGDSGEPRALTIYLLAKGGTGRDAEFTALRRRIEAVLGSHGRRPSEAGATGDYDAYAVFDVKPFAIESFKVQSRDGAVETATKDGTTQCAGKARFDEATQTFVIEDQPMNRSCEVTAILTVRFPDRWCLKDTGLSGALAMKSGDPALRQQSIYTLQVTPPRATLCSAEQKLRVSLRFDAFSFKEGISFGDRLSRTFAGDFEAKGVLTVVGEVARNNVNLGQGVQSAWSYPGSDAASPSADTQRRVYRLEEVVRQVIPEDQLKRTELARYDVKVKVLYEQSPLLGLLVIVLIVLALLVLLALLLGKRRSFLIEPEGGDEVRAEIGLGQTAGAVSGDGALRVSITNLALLLLASSNGRILRGKVLSLSGGRVEAAAAGSRPVKSKRRPVKSRSSDDDDDDYYDDSDADDASAGSYDGGGGGERIVFVVRELRDGKRGGRNRDAHDDDDAF